MKRDKPVPCRADVVETLARHPIENMNHLWLGYDGLSVQYADVRAIVYYHSSYDRRIAQAYGRVPTTVRTVVVMNNGAFLPSSWRPEYLREALSRWRKQPDNDRESV